MGGKVWIEASTILKRRRRTKLKRGQMAKVNGLAAGEGREREKISKTKNKAAFQGKPALNWADYST